MTGSLSAARDGRQPKGSIARVAIALIIGAALLALAVRQVDWSAVARAVTNASAGWLVLTVLGLTLMQVLTAVRWRTLVNTNHELSFAETFDFVMIGNLAGVLLSARLGDVARAMAAGRRHSHGTSRLLGTILVERLFDVVLLLFFGVVLAVLMSIPPIVQGAMATLFGAALVLGVVLWMGHAGPLGIVGRWVDRVRGPESRLATMFRRFVDGIAAIRDDGRVLPGLMVSALLWLSASATMACTVAAFHIGAPWYAGAFVVLVVNLGGIVPAPPAGIGVYHYLAMLSLAPWGISASSAFAFALVSHALSITIVLAIGAASLTRQGLTLGGLKRLTTAANAES